MFVPIEHRPDLAEPQHHLLLRMGGKMVTVWVAKDHCRYFLKNDLPDVFRRALAMISTSDNAYYVSSDSYDYASNPTIEDYHPEKFYQMLYTTSKNEAPEQLRDIGWRVSDKYYYVVVPEGVVNQLIVGAEKFDREKA